MYNRYRALCSTKLFQYYERKVDENACLFEPSDNTVCKITLLPPSSFKISDMGDAVNATALRLALSNATLLQYINALLNKKLTAWYSEDSEPLRKGSISSSLWLFCPPQLFSLWWFSVCTVKTSS